MARVSLKVNGRSRGVDTDASTQLLYVLRGALRLNRPKFERGLPQHG